MHDRGPGRQVGTEPHPVRVPDPDAGRHHVVDHPGELVDAEHGQRATVGPCPLTGVRQFIKGDRSERRPRHVRQQSEDAVQVDGARPHEPVRQQVEAQVDVCDRVGRRLQVGDGGGHRVGRDAADMIGRDPGRQIGHVQRGVTQSRLRVPDLDDLAGGAGGDPDGAGRSTHVGQRHRGGGFAHRDTVPR